MYAVVKIGGRQYRTSEGEILEVDKLDEKPGERIEFDQVLLLTNDGGVRIGQPFVPGVKVIGKILEQIKGPKLKVARFKAKVRYRRVKGFRPFLTKVQIEKIEFTRAPKLQEGGKKTTKKNNG